MHVDTSVRQKLEWRRRASLLRFRDRVALPLLGEPLAPIAIMISGYGAERLNELGGAGGDRDHAVCSRKESSREAQALRPGERSPISPTGQRQVCKIAFTARVFARSAAVRAGRGTCARSRLEGRAPRRAAANSGTRGVSHHVCPVLSATER